jgi:hypothetical protein
MKTLFAVSTALLLFLSAAHAAPAEEVMQNGGFELPVVKARTPNESGGNPVNGGVQSLWQSFNIISNPAGGVLSAGLTNEIARTGTQSFFLKFDNVSLSYQCGILIAMPVPVMPSSPYRVSLWGRLDKTNPLILGDRQSYLRIQIEYFAADGETPVGDPEYKIQPLPGSKNRDPLFTADKWNEFFMDITTPADAAFIGLSLKVETGPNPGKTNGIIYFDDFSIRGEPSPLKIPKPKPEETPEPAQSADTTGTSGTTGTAN